MGTFIPDGSYKKAKYTPGFAFVVESTGENYKGYYIEDSNGKFYSGKAPGKDTVDLKKLDNKPTSKLKQGLRAALIALALGLAGKVISSMEKQNGKTKRYFVQDKTTTKIAETDKDTFNEAKVEMTNQNFAQVDWIIAGPAEDQTFNGYPYEGAASKNKKAIQALESQMPGISAFVTDYSYLVEEPTEKPVADVETQTVKDSDTTLQNSRKANFDTKQ